MNEFFHRLTSAADSGAAGGFPGPLRTDFIGGFALALLFLAGAAVIVLLGVRSMAGLGPVRKWVAIGLRLAVFLLALLVLAGAQWTRRHTDVEVIVVRDISQSTTQVKDFPGPEKSLQPALDNYFRELAVDPEKEPDDRIGVLSFHQSAYVDALPAAKLSLGGRSVRELGTGTDPGAAIQFALASMSKDAMHRLLLVWDGNMTVGGLEDAIATAASQRVPIDVMPLRYDVKQEVLVDRIIAPTWKRENEPFSLEITLRSTNELDVSGNLSVLHQGEQMDLDPRTAAKETVRRVTLKPGLNRQTIRVPANLAGGVHQFRAMWDGDAGVAVESPAGSTALTVAGDTLAVNNVAEAFTFVQGKGQVLYVDAVRDGDGAGDMLPRALKSEGIDLVPVTVDQFPANLIQLSQYDAVVLANVARSALGEPAQESLARYVHEMGGGLVMIGGEDAFGAGGWQGSALEKVLPVDMDIPAQRQVSQGALVLVVDRSGSMGEPFGGATKQDAVNQAAILALRALSERDLVGVVSFDAAAQWVFKLQVNRYADHLVDSLKRIGMGGGTYLYSGLEMAVPALEQSGASAKHILLLTDGQTNPADYGPLFDRMRKAKISLSTVGVGASHDAALLTKLAQDGKGRYYNVSSPNLLPQVFIKEAMVVRRHLIQESETGIPLHVLDGSDDFVKGLDAVEPLFGMVLTTKKDDPKVQMPIAARTSKDGVLDPVLAHWQSGLGRAAVFTGDAHGKWGARWVASSAYSKFWAQVVRGVARPPMSTDFDVRTTQDGDKGKIVVEAIDKDNKFLNFMTIGGSVLGPDNKPHPVRAVQVAPGRYEAEFPITQAGSYVAALSYTDRDGKGGVLHSGVASSTSPELRDLKSNEARLREVASRTGGRFIERPFDVPSARVFRREGLFQSASTMPVWDLLMPFLLGLIVLDVAVRRIAWDWASTKRLALGAAAFVRSHTTTRKVESRGAVDALSTIRQKQGDQPASIATPNKPVASLRAAAVRPDPKAKFTASGASAKAAEGDTTQVLGGATNKPVPPPVTGAQPKGLPASAGQHVGDLMAAKRRARQKIEGNDREG